jgi:dihydropyrimidinase
MVADRFDMVIRGGTVVTGDSESRADVGIRDGRIAQLGGSMTGETTIEAEDRLVFPGGIDMHVHFSPPWTDDFSSGSRAAAAGGVTTVGSMVFPEPGQSMPAAVEHARAGAEADSIVDFVLHPVLSEPSESDIADLGTLAASGHTSVKVFMIASDFDARVGDYLRALSAAAANGMLTLVHCEDAALVDFATTTLLRTGRGAVRFYGETRPAASEATAVARILAYAGTVGAPVYIVHLGSAAALAETRRARAAGQPVYVETRPIYLHFTRDAFERPDGALYVGNPPLGGQADQDALWHGLQSGDIHTCCTDHAAWKREQKLDPDLTVATARPGTSDLETLLPLLYSEGVRTGRLSRQRFVQVTSTNAAKLFGMFPQKGTIAVGSDADVVVWDPQLTRTVDGAETVSAAGHSLYDGWEITGGPAVTIGRGEILYSEGSIVADAGRGRLVRRGPTRPL